MGGDAKGPFRCGHLHVNSPAWTKGTPDFDQGTTGADLDEMDHASRPERHPNVKVRRNEEARFGATIDNDVFHGFSLIVAAGSGGRSAHGRDAGPHPQTNVPEAGNGTRHWKLLLER